MKIVYINTYCNGSTGNIVNKLSEFATKQGDQTFLFYGREKNKNTKWSYFGLNLILSFVNNVLVYLNGLIGSMHVGSTKRLIKSIKKIKPDIIHIHNIHGNYLNFKLLFNFLKASNIPILFTLHDEFLFTGRCASIGCEKFYNGCGKCKKLNLYPHALIDKSKIMFYQKKQFLSAQNFYFACPSLFIKNNFHRFFGSEDKIELVYNGIDLDVFKPRKLIKEKKIRVIAVANPWNKEKGIDFINKLLSLIDFEKVEFVIVGVDNKTRKQFNTGPIFFSKVDKTTLSFLYNSSDICLVCSNKESFSLVTVEALASGIPVFSSDTGTAYELINEDNGIVYEKNDKTISSLANKINSFQRGEYKEENCRNSVTKYSDYRMCKEYYDLYEKMVARYVK